jgi:hypothetical protein
MDYVWHHSASTIKQHQFPFPPYAAAFPWLTKRGNPFLGFGPAPHPDGPLHMAVGPQPGDSKLYQSAFRPVHPALPRPLESEQQPYCDLEACSDEETVDIETTEDDAQAGPDTAATCWSKDQVSADVSHLNRGVNASSCTFLTRPSESMMREMHSVLRDEVPSTCLVPRPVSSEDC